MNRIQGAQMAPQCAFPAGRRGSAVRCVSTLCDVTGVAPAERHACPPPHLQSSATPCSLEHQNCTRPKGTASSLCRCNALYITLQWHVPQGKRREARSAGHRALLPRASPHASSPQSRSAPGDAADGVRFFDRSRSRKPRLWQGDHETHNPLGSRCGVEFLGPTLGQWPTARAVR